MGATLSKSGLRRAVVPSGWRGAAGRAAGVGLFVYALSCIHFFVRLSPKKRREVIRTLWNLRRFPPTVAINTVRWALSLRGLFYFYSRLRIRLSKKFEDYRGKAFALGSIKDSLPPAVYQCSITAIASGPSRAGGPPAVAASPTSSSLAALSLSSDNDSFFVSSGLGAAAGTGAGVGEADSSLLGGSLVSQVLRDSSPGRRPIGNPIWSRGENDPGRLDGEVDEEAAVGTESDRHTLRVNRTFCYVTRSSTELPESVRDRVIPTLHERIESVQASVWVETPGLGALFPYVVPEEWQPLLRDLEAGQAAPSSLLAFPAIVETLREHRVLMTDAEVEAEEAHWDAVVDQGRVSLRENGYVKLNGLLPASHMDALRDHYRAIYCHKRYIGTMRYSEEGYWFRWREPSARFVAGQLNALVCRMADEEVVVSPPLCLWYQRGSMLGLHTDGATYAYSLSITIDEDRRADQNPWSISLITKSLTGAAVVDVPMGVGDAILFRGQEHPHYRDPYENQSVTSMSMSWDRRSY